MKKEVGVFFDIDGTLSRNSLLIEHFKTLIENKTISKKEWLEEIEETCTSWETRNGNFEDYLLSLVSIYKKAITRKKVKSFKRSIDKTIQRSNKFYTYTLRKLKEHQEQGHKIFFISGSPSFLVCELAKKFNITDFIASTYTIKKEFYTGEVIGCWNTEQKITAIKELASKHDIDLTKSYSYGDTTGDISLFETVAYPTAINPNQRLLEYISKSKLKDKIKMIVERKDVVYEIKLENIL